MMPGSVELAALIDDGVEDADAPPMTGNGAGASGGERGRIDVG